MEDATSLTPPSPGLSATLLPNKSVESYSPKRTRQCKINITISMYGKKGHDYIQAEHGFLKCTLRGVETRAADTAV